MAMYLDGANKLTIDNPKTPTISTSLQIAPIPPLENEFKKSILQMIKALKTEIQNTDKNLYLHYPPVETVMATFLRQIRKYGPASLQAKNDRRINFLIQQFNAQPQLFEIIKQNPEGTHQFEQELLETPWDKLWQKYVSSEATNDMPVASRSSHQPIFSTGSVIPAPLQTARPAMNIASSLERVILEYTKLLQSLIDASGHRETTETISPRNANQLMATFLRAIRQGTLTELEASPETQGVPKHWSHWLTEVFRRHPILQSELKNPYTHRSSLEYLEEALLEEDLTTLLQRYSPQDSNPPELHPTQQKDKKCVVM